MKKNRLRLISIIDLLFTNKQCSHEDIKSLETYEKLIHQTSIDALRMLVTRDIKDLKKLKIIQDSKTEQDYYELTIHFEKIRKEYYQKLDSLYKSELSDEELVVAYTSTEEMAETIFDAFSISKEKRIAIRKSMELESFLDGFTLALKVDNTFKVTKKNMQKLAVDIMFEDYLLPENYGLDWKSEEKRAVISLVSQGRCIDQIAKKFKRTRIAIIRQLPELQIIKDHILGVSSEIKKDPEAIYRLFRIGLLQQDNNEAYKLSDRLQSILEWNKSAKVNPTELSENILYDNYFSNCKGKEFIPLSGLHLDIQKADLVQNYFTDEEVEEINAVMHEATYWETKGNLSAYSEACIKYNNEIKDDRKILEKINEINTDDEPDIGH